jgi:hypothetical protein
MAEETKPPILPVDEAAIAYARRFNLITEDGQIVCMKNCGRLAMLPSLCCRECLAAHRERWR